MTQQFFIILHMKVRGELLSFGKFELGNYREEAYTLFRQLKGSSNIDYEHVLFMELTETANNLPANIKILSCTLDELSANCRIITKALFRKNNIGQ